MDFKFASLCFHYGAIFGLVVSVGISTFSDTIPWGTMFCTIVLELMAIYVLLLHNTKD